MSHINKYALLTRILHWSFIPLLAFSIISGKIMSHASFEDPLSYYLPPYHYLCGLCLFVLLITRITLRIKNTSPDYSNNVSKLNIFIAKSVQYLMLLMISLVIISGYLLATADGNPAKLPWGSWLIQLLDDDTYTLDFMLSVHLTSLSTFLALLFLHVAGFIKQQLNDSSFIKRIF